MAHNFQVLMIMIIDKTSTCTTATILTILVVKLEEEKIEARAQRVHMMASHPRQRLVILINHHFWFDEDYVVFLL